MQLFSTSGFPAPAGGMVRALPTADGLTLRVARWAPDGPSRGTLVIAQGRGEFIEKYFEVIGELLTRGFQVVAFDWRGQGLSTREMSNPRKGHIDDFSHYLLDLDALRELVLAPSCERPWFGLGHSMGGAILLQQAHERRSPFERMVLTAPMIDLAGLRFPRVVRALATTLDVLGLGSLFIPGGGETAYLTKPFENNALTSDPVLYAQISQIAHAHPEVSLGAPTISWLTAAFRLMRSFEAGEYAARISTPCLIIAAGADRVVATPAAARFALAMKAGYCLTIAQSRHEILIEREVFRAQFWAAFDAFIPGAVSELHAYDVMDQLAAVSSAARPARR